MRAFAVAPVTLNTSGAAPVPLIAMGTAWRVVALACLLFVFVVAQPVPIAMGRPVYLLLYSAVETSTIVALCVVFAAAWNARQASTRQLMLACALLGGAVLTFLYMYSHADTQSVFTANAPGPAVDLWWAGRLLVAGGILVAASLPSRHMATTGTRRFALGGTLLLVAAIALAEWGWSGALPWLSAETRSAFKAALNALPFGVLAGATVVAWWRRAYSPERPTLFAACAVAALAEAVFVTQSPPFSVSILLGHLFEAVAYYLAYCALFVAPIAAPFERIDALRSELRQAEERWRHALDAAGLGVSDWDIASGRVFRSQTFCDILGYSPAELDAMPAGLEPLVYPDDLPRARAAMTRRRAGQSDALPDEIRMRGKDGQYRWLSVRGTVVRRGADGQALRVIGTAADISEHKALEHKLLQLTGDLRALMAREHQQVEAERKRIAQALHDDLGQYLVALRMDTARLADQRDKPDQQRETIGRLDDAIDGAREAVRRAIANLRPAALDELGLVVAVRRLAEQWGHQHEQKVEVAISGSWDDVPEVYRTELYRILVEALNNAAKHAHSRSVHVALMRGPDAVHLTVADDGQGLSPNSPQIPGHYGLFGISERVTHLGGTTSLQSAPGLGTELSVSLPLVPTVQAR